MKIANGKVVELEYQLYIDDEERELVEDTRDDGSLEFIFGTEPLLEKLAATLEGLEAGAVFTVAIPCEEAFGEELEDAIVEFPISDFIVDGELDEEVLEEGAVVPFEDESGDVIYGVVVEKKLNSVVIDLNHPLAGEDIVYEGKVIAVREATAEDMADISEN
jgi:FKBP-type peptidyl-prolyl cis-trans isomerase SlyD